MRNECQRRKIFCQKSRGYVKIGIGSQYGLAKISPHIVKRKSLISKDFFFPWQWEFQQMSRSYRHFRIKCA